MYFHDPVGIPHLSARCEKLNEHQSSLHLNYTVPRYDSRIIALHVSRLKKLLAQ